MISDLNSIPRVTVLITTRNRLAYLPRAIESVFSQSVACEVLVVDDASDDDTEAYCRGLGEKIVYLRNDLALGQSASINRGIETARGEWIKHLDDDDYLREDCLPVLLALVDCHPGTSIAVCTMTEIDMEGKEGLGGSGSGRAFYIPQEDLHYAMLHEWVPFGPTSQVMVRREAYLRHGGWEPRFKVFNDSDAWTKAGCGGDAVFLDRALVYHMVWPDSITIRTSVERHWLNLLEVKERIMERVTERHRASLPSPKTVRQYLGLHWGLVALKRRQWATALRLGVKGAFSPSAWQLLVKARCNPDRAWGGGFGRELEFPAAN